jgi:hypothetical protein
MRTIGACALVAFTLLPDAGDERANDRARFTGSALVRPDRYDRWPLVGASLGLSYADKAEGSGPPVFHRVYMNPSSYEKHRERGTFPDGTVFVLELYESQQKQSIAKGGFFEGKRLAVEASVKDRSRFPGGWRYFSFENGARATAEPFPTSRCHSCHVAHGQVDSVFVQFYPNLRAQD